MASEVVSKGSKRLKLSPNRPGVDEETKHDVRRSTVIESGQSIDDTMSDEKTIELNSKAK